MQSNWLLEILISIILQKIPSMLVGIKAFPTEGSQNVN